MLLWILKLDIFHVSSSHQFDIYCQGTDLNTLLKCNARPSKLCVCVCVCVPSEQSDAQIFKVKICV
jgi:hypothetical protein